MIDANGDFIWAKAIIGRQGDNRPYSIATDNFGNIYTTGLLNGTADFDPESSVYNLTSTGNVDIFILKLNASGDFAWAKNIGNVGYNYGNCIALDDLSENVFVSGLFIGACEYSL